MPIYEYQCKKCEHIFEEMLSVNDYQKPLSEPCPNCKELGSVERYFEADSISRPCFSYLGSSIQSKPSLKSSPFSDRLQQIKKNFGGKQGFCKGIE